MLSRTEVDLVVTRRLGPTRARATCVRCLRRLGDIRVPTHQLPLFGQD
ncbi:hypothetical protein K7711_36465 [Nocardia sp. CA2R105]|nr:hypothetical protein [Nocardia coffeae]MBY8862018.1 hypothetical protein [Nocardia coffeae]